MEPRGQDRVRAQAGGFAGEDEKDGLRYLPGLNRIANLPERNRIDQADMPADQRLKGRFGIPGGVLPHQVHVIRIGHLPIYYRPRRIRTFFFRGQFRTHKSEGRVTRGPNMKHYQTNMGTLRARPSEANHL